ncbi:IclR family transcriptional regulator [Roseovarius sp. C7]|uniref:IclR family transcriptional regulator n=1 Tax=Roseovarius sp. C7 TaxID=3398643 RepID=UPI0039F68AC0
MAENRIEQRPVATGTVAKAVQILTLVTSPPRHFSTVSEIAEELAIPRPTATRLVNNLIKLGMLKREAGGKKIIEGDDLVGLAAATLTGSASRGPRHEILHELVLATRETANIGTLVNGQVVYLDRVEALWPLAFRLEIGSRVPLYCSALGKLILAMMPDDQLDKYLDTVVLRSLTENTLKSQAELADEISQIRRDGISIDREECFEGVIGIAVPVISAPPTIGLALVAPSSRQTPEGLRQLVPLMQDAADRLAKCYHVG